MKRNNQSGFSIVEALLIIVILGILGFTGYFVYYSKQTADKNLSSTSSASNTAPSKTSSNLQIVQFTELGVKASVPAELGPVTYTYNAASQTVMLVSGLQDSVKSDVYCANNQSPWGIKKSDNPEKYYNGQIKDGYKQVGNQWYYREWPQAGCDSSVDKNLAAKIDAGYKTLFDSLAPIQ